MKANQMDQTLLQKLAKELQVSEKEIISKGLRALQWILDIKKSNATILRVDENDSACTNLQRVDFLL